MTAKVMWKSELFGRICVSSSTQSIYFSYYVMYVLAFCTSLGVSIFITVSWHLHQTHTVLFLQLHNQWRKCHRG